MLALCLLICYASTIINPVEFWIPALIGLAYQVLLLLNILFLVYWIFRWKIEFLISLIAIALGINHLTAYIQLPFGQNKTQQEAKIKLITYNVNMFQLYSWSSKKPVYNEIAEFVNKQKFNVVCFQEFYVRNDKFTENDAKAKFNMNISSKYVVKNSKTGYGIATFSKFPIVNSGSVDFKNTYNACIFTDIKVDNDTIRIYNAHLQSFRFNESNLKFLQNEFNDKKGDTYKEVWDIVARLRNAFEKRAIQVDSISAHAARCKYPVIICGDFNDTPLSYTYRTLTKNRKDSYIEAGQGINSTYRKFVAAYRIDYALHSKQLKAIRYACPKIEYSDHYPVSVEFTTN